MSSKQIQFTQVASSTPFDNSTNGFVASDTQGAIEEAKLLASNASRGTTTCGFDGTASSGRFLEFFSNNPSNNNPLILPENSQLIAIAISASANSTGTVTLFKNGVLATTIALSAARKNAISGLSVSFLALDEISIQVTAGSISRPTVFLNIRTTP